MISVDDIEKSVAILKNLGATRIVLFGSAIQSPDVARDIDIACAGLPDGQFIRAIGEIVDTIGKAVDLVDISKPSRKADFIERSGRVLYERT